MNEIKSFILRFTKERNLTVIALAEKLGYKSKTSLDRLMNANSRESSIQKFEELMLAAFDLSETERAALHRAVRIACEGEEQYRISEKMHALIFTHNTPQTRPNRFFGTPKPMGLSTGRNAISTRKTCASSFGIAAAFPRCFRFWPA